jgi:hypothetical protein
MKPGQRVEHESDRPATLDRIMQKMIGEGLREHYKRPKKLSHGLFVLMMQLKEQERSEAAARAASARKRDRCSANRRSANPI